MKVCEFIRKIESRDVIFVKRFSCGCEVQVDVLSELEWNYYDLDEPEYMDRMRELENDITYYDDFRYDDDEILYLINNVDSSTCSSCKYEQVRCIDFPRPSEFDSMRFFHGVNAFGISGDGDENMIKVLSNSTMELCCSTKTLGSMGVILKGEVLLASNRDLCSMIGEDGHRCISLGMASDIIYTKDQMKKTITNDEYVVTNYKVSAIWVRRGYMISSTVLKKAKELGLHIVEI